jgi:ABC-type phosphate/phosphonate transport system substrate-binding protein
MRSNRLLPLILLSLMGAMPGASLGAESSREPLQVRIYASLMAGISDHHARAFTRPIIDLVSREMQYPMQFDIAEGATAEDLWEFGQQIEDGEIHVGIIWGVEYGWLRKRFPRIKPMVVTRHSTSHLKSQLMVHPDSEATDLAGVRGQRLATYSRMPLMDELFLSKAVEDGGGTWRQFFPEVVEHKTAIDAILAVRGREADCVMVNTTLYQRHIANRPKLELKAVALSAPFPQAVLVGRPERVNALRPGLWLETRDCLRDVEDTPEGRQSLDFWRQERFILPGADNFEQLVQARIAQYPVTALAKVARDRRRP